MAKEDELKGAQIIARLDRLPSWAFNYLLLGVVGIGELFAFYDIFDINVSFPQTAVTLFHVPPTRAAPLLGPIVLGNLLGYAIGSIILSPIADRIGRRDMLMITMLIMGLSSFFNAAANSYITFLIARTLTGVGVGAELAIVSTYISEVAPTSLRARYLSLIFLFAALGSFLGVWLGLILTTHPAPIPRGLPIALGGSGFFATNGWRIMYVIGGILAVIGLLLRFQLPESPRWLITKGRSNEAERIVGKMEEKLIKRGISLPQLPNLLNVIKTQKPVPYAEILTNTFYLKRIGILLPITFLIETTVYTISTGLTVILAAHGYTTSEAGFISAIGILGFILSQYIDIEFGEKLERKFWIAIAAIVTVVGGIIIAITPNIIIDAIAAIILFVGENVWVPILHTWTAESFPTRARTSGFALCDGIGHFGGGVGVVYVTSIALSLSTLPLFGVIVSFLVIAGILSLIVGHYTANKRLDEISP